jgi:hypothetical protein
MRSVENDDLVFPEGEIPARCEHCKRDGEITLRVRCGNVGQDGRPVTPEDARMFRPERVFIVVPSGLEVVATLQRMLIGSESCMVSDNPIVVSVFAETAPDMGICLPTIAPGIEATLVLRNPSDKPIKVAAKFRGTSAYLDPADYAAGTD